ncbi:MAG: MFS transporter [Simkaniaceae bacterium]|nr:MAG: MFS transporter [Simkaniaceae bacterium]
MKTNFNSSLLPVYFVLFVDNFAFAITFSIFGPLFVDSSYGFISKAMSMSSINIMIGVALATFPLGQLIGAPLLGDIADRFGRKKAFYITILGGTAGVILSGFSIMIHSYIALILTRLVTGFFSGNLSICLASIADLSPDEKTRARNFSVIIIITGISWMLAILSGAYYSDPNLSGHFNLALPFFITGIFFILTFLAIAYFFKETHKTNDPFRINLLQGFKDVIDTFTIKKLRLLYLIYMLWILGWGITLQWYNPFVLEKFHSSTTAVNWSLFLVGITWMFGGYFVNNFLIKRWRGLPLIVIANALITVCLLGMSLMSSFIPFAIFFTISCIPAAFSWPNIMNLISINAPGSIQGKVMGISQSFRSMSFILATLLGGLLAGINLTSLYYFATLSFFLSFILIFLKYFRIKKATP